jgi:hypothetical protein
MELYPQKWHLPSFPISAGNEFTVVQHIKYLVAGCYYYIRLPDLDLIAKMIQLDPENQKYVVVKTLYKRKTGALLGAWIACKEHDPNYYLGDDVQFFIRTSNSSGESGTFEFDMHHFRRAKDLGRSILRFIKKQSKPLTVADIAASDKLYEPYNTARTNSLF